MAKVKGKDTGPEIAVRRIAHALGFRFRLHRSDLPGSPDLVFPSLRAVVFVHGCFWHRHAGCAKASSPKTRKAFWNAKFEANVARDARAERRLRRLGWRVMTVWECQTKDRARVAGRLARFLGRRSGV
jgi:DNA mismatch endonuclease (patch repair protein)